MATIRHAAGSIRTRMLEAVPGWGWLLLAGGYLASCWASIVTRTQWGPDSRLYLAWAYRYLGYSELDAAHRTRDYLANMDGVKGATDWFAPGFEHGLFNGSDGAVVGARPLYPLLSAPFVALMGPTGMLVVPFVSYAFVVVGVALLAHRLWGRHWGLLAGAMILGPVIVSRWAVMAQTEGLAIGLTVACLLFLPLGRAGTRRQVVGFGVLLLLNLCVRQFALVLTLGVALVWALVLLRDRSWRNPWLPFAAVAVVLTGVALEVQSVVTSHWFGGAALDLGARYSRLTGQVFHAHGVASVPKVLRYLARNEYAYMRTDVLLLGTVALAVVAACWRWRSELTVLTAGATLGTVALNVVVIWPTGYRYMVPIHPLVLLCGLALIADWVAHRRPSRSTEAPASAVAPVPPRPAVFWDVSLPGWVLVGLAYAFTAGVVWRRDRPHVSIVAVGLSFLLMAAAVGLVTGAVARRFGTGAGVTAGVALGLSAAVLGPGLASWRTALVLACAALVVRLLPPGDGTPGRWLPTGRAAELSVGVAVALAVAARPAGVALAGGVALGWLGAREAGRRWSRYALIAVPAGVLALAVRLLVTGAHWHTQTLNHAVSADLRSLAPDRVLYLTCLLAVVAVVVRRRNPMAWFAVGTVAVATVVHLGHGRPAGFADYVAAYPALFLIIAALLAPWCAVPSSLVPAAGEDPAPPAPVARTRPDRVEHPDPLGSR